MDWLTSISGSDSGDYGYARLLENIDKIIITVTPKIIGTGIHLFDQNTKEANRNLIETTTFNTGVLNLTYAKPING